MIVKNFLDMGKKIVNLVQEVKRVPYRINTRRKTRHMLIKLKKIKQRESILKPERVKQ